MSAGDLAPLVQRFFTDRLGGQLDASPNTVAAYRDAFRLLLRFASDRYGLPPTALSVADVDAGTIAAFLDHLEKERGCKPRSRNARLAAYRSFFRFVAVEEPAHLLHAQRVLAMRSKKHETVTVAFLEPDEVRAVLAAPDRTTRLGRRDHALLLVMLETGLRVSEVAGLKGEDVRLGTGAHVRCMGKGRKRRATPIRREVAAVLEAWMVEVRCGPADPLFPTMRGSAIGRDAIEHLVRKHAATASATCPTLRAKTVTPHVLRHTTAMTLLRGGVDQVVIALWLGHEQVATTQVYVHADMRMKERAMARMATTERGAVRFKPDDRLLAFLEAL